MHTASFHAGGFDEDQQALLRRDGTRRGGVMATTEPNAEWAQVWSAEQSRIALRRRAQDISDEPSSASVTVGLALSGGGIRSATFSLGLMRALAQASVLGGFDYLSTVSGGYAGAFFNSLFARWKPSSPKPATPEKAAPLKGPGRRYPMRLCAGRSAGREATGRMRAGHSGGCGVAAATLLPRERATTSTPPPWRFATCWPSTTCWD